MLAHLEGHQRSGAAFLGLQGAALAGLGLVGGDDLVEPLAQDREVAGVVAGGVVDQKRLGRGPLLGGDGVGSGGGERVEGVGDGAGLVGIDRPRCEGCLEPMVARVERVGEVEVGTGVLAALPGLAGGPVSSRALAGLGAGAAALGLGEHLQAQRGQP